MLPKHNVFDSRVEMSYVVKYHREILLILLGYHWRIFSQNFHIVVKTLASRNA